MINVGEPVKKRLPGCLNYPQPATYAFNLGGCNCNDNSTKVYLTPQRSGCNHAVVDGLVRKLLTISIFSSDPTTYFMQTNSGLF